MKLIYNYCKRLLKAVRPGLLVIFSTCWSVLESLIE